MNEKVSELDTKRWQIMSPEIVQTRGEFQQRIRIALQQNEFANWEGGGIVEVIELSEYDNLAEVNKVLVEALEDLKVQFDTFSKQQWSQITQVPVKENEFPRQDFIDFNKCFSALAKAKEMGK